MRVHLNGVLALKIKLKFDEPSKKKDRFSEPVFSRIILDGYLVLHIALIEYTAFHFRRSGSVIGFQYETYNRPDVQLTLFYCLLQDSTFVQLKMAFAIKINDFVLIRLAFVIDYFIHSN